MEKIEVQKRFVEQNQGRQLFILKCLIEIFSDESDRIWVFHFTLLNNCLTQYKIQKLVSKTVGDKMKAKEAVGDPATPVPKEVVDNLDAVTPETLNTLTVMQLKKMSTLVDAESKKNVEMMEKCEKDRHRQLFDIGNILHPSGEVVVWSFV